MTDKEKVKTLLEELNIGHTESDEALVIETSDFKVNGEAGLIVLFDFGADGTFVELEIGRW